LRIARTIGPRIISHPNDLDNPAASAAVERFVRGAVDAFAAGEPLQMSQYDSFPAPLYSTDADGTVTYFNKACVDFVGRVPAIGKDRYCVSWKLRTGNGTPLAHDECPMAVALREGRAVRGVTAIAERPDGEQRGFQPFATPALDADGQVVGGVNLLVPTDGEVCRDLLATAQRCRRLSQWVDDTAASDSLGSLATECEGQAAILRLD
jgi:PAS domain-containing protein